MVALFHEGDFHHTAADRWFAEKLSGSERLAAPSILLPEVAGAIARSARDSGLAERAVREMLDDSLVQLFTVTEERSRAAANFAHMYGLRGCDSLYVALAVELNEPLVTVDNEQLERGGAVAVTRRPDG